MGRGGHTGREGCFRWGEGIGRAVMMVSGRVTHPLLITATPLPLSLSFVFLSSSLLLPPSFPDFLSPSLNSFPQSFSPPPSHPSPFTPSSFSTLVPTPLSPGRRGVNNNRAAGGCKMTRPRRNERGGRGRSKICRASPALPHSFPHGAGHHLSGW